MAIIVPPTPVPTKTPPPPPVVPDTQSWYQKWLGGGALGSAIWRPTEWFGGTSSDKKTTGTPPGVTVKGAGIVTEGGQQDPLNQQYFDWLKAYFRFQYPDDFDETGTAKEGSVSRGNLDFVANQLDSGASVYSMPFFKDFTESYAAYGDIYGGASTQETDYVTAQTEKLKAETQQLLNEIAQSGNITPYQQAQLDQNLKELEVQMNQWGITNEQSRAQLELSKQQLDYQRQLAIQEQAQSYNEWLTQLQANPANWIERWYAERMPQGGSRIPLQSDVVINKGAASPYVPWGQTNQIPTGQGSLGSPTF